METLKIDDSTESDENDKNRKRRVKSNATPDAQWAKPPSKGLLDILNQRKQMIEIKATPQQPKPMEQVFEASEVKKDKDDDEEEGNKEKDGEEEQEDSPANAPQTAESVEFVETNIADTQASETLAAESEPNEKVFETFAASAPIPENMPPTTDFEDLPHVKEDQPSIRLTPEENRAFSGIAGRLEPRTDDKPKFEDIMQREMPEDYAEATSDTILGATNDRRKPSIPSWDMPAVESSFDHAPENEKAPSPPPSFGPATFKDGPYSYTTIALGPEADPGSRTAASISELARGVSAVMEVVKAVGDFGGFNPNQLIRLADVALEAYLVARRQERNNKESSLNKRLYEESLRLQERQRIANERLDALFQHQAKQAAQVHGERRIAGADGEEIVLKPGERLEHGPAGYAYIMGEGGRVVDRDIHKNEFYHEQQRERLSDDTFAALQTGDDASAGNGPMPPFPPAAGTDQGRQAADQQLVLNQIQADLSHRLPLPRKTIREAALNPWLWTAVAVLIIIYFVATLA